MSFFSPVSVHQSQYPNTLPLNARASLCPAVSQAQQTQQAPSQQRLHPLDPSRQVPNHHLIQAPPQQAQVVGQQTQPQSQQQQPNSQQSQPQQVLQQAPQQKPAHVNHVAVSNGAMLDHESGAVLSSAFGYAGQCVPLMTPSTDVLQNLQVQQQRAAELLNAVYRHDLDLITDLIVNYHVDPDSRELSQRAPLHIAALNGHIQIAKSLIELGANVNIQDSNLNTPLHLAAQCGHTRTVDVLLSFGKADETILNVEKKTPFQLAIDFGHGQNKIMRQLFHIQDSNNNNLNMNNNNSANNGLGMNNSISNSNSKSSLNGATSVNGNNGNNCNGADNNNNVASYQNGNSGQAGSVSSANGVSCNGNSGLANHTNSQTSSAGRPARRERRLSQLPPSPCLLPVPAMLDSFRKCGIYYPIRTSYRLLSPHFGCDPDLILRHIQESFKLKNIEDMIEKLQDIENSFKHDELLQYEVVRRNQQDYIDYENRRRRYRMEKFNRNRVIDNREKEEVNAYIHWRSFNHERICELLRYLDSLL